MKLEDVWHILQIPINGEHMVYDVDVGGDTIFQLFNVDEYKCVGGKIDLHRYENISVDLTLFVGALILGFLVLNKWARGYSVGWGIVWSYMVGDMVVFKFGPIVLASLYHYMQ